MTSPLKDPDYKEMSIRMAAEFNRIINWFEKGTQDYADLQRLFLAVTVGMAELCKNPRITSAEDIRATKDIANALDKLEAGLREYHGIQDCTVFSESADELRECTDAFERSRSQGSGHSR